LCNTRAGEDPADVSPRVEHAVLHLELPALLHGPAEFAVDHLVIVGMDGFEMALMGGSRVGR